MLVKIKKLVENAVIPSYSRDGDAGLDLTATSVYYVYGDNAGLDYIEYLTGIALQIPKGYVGLIYPRSSISNYDLMLCNHVAVIDSNYNGEIKLRFRITNKKDFRSYTLYSPGDRIAQLMIVPYPAIQFIESQTLDDTNRGDGAFGSSGS